MMRKPPIRLESLFAGCLAAAGAIYASDEGLPSPTNVVNYARRLYEEALKEAVQDAK